MTPRYVSISRRGRISIKDPGGKVVGKSTSLAKAKAAARIANEASGHTGSVRVVDNREKKKRRK